MKTARAEEVAVDGAGPAKRRRTESETESESPLPRLLRSRPLGIEAWESETVDFDSVVDDQPKSASEALDSVVEEQQAKVADPPIDAEIVQGLVQALSAMHKQIEFLKACCQELSLSITQMASVNMETIDATLRLHPGA